MDSIRLDADAKYFGYSITVVIRLFLEENATLLHFEKILAKAMKNPLANAVKIGIYG